MTVTESGYSYQLRYALWRAVWIAAGGDALAHRARMVRVEIPLRDRYGRHQSVDVAIEGADGDPIELIETKEHESFLPLASLESFLTRAEAMRTAVPPSTRFRFVCNQKLTAGLDLSRSDDLARALSTRGVAALNRPDVDWDLGVWSKSSLVDRTLVLLASAGGDARDLYCRLYARAHAQLAMRRPRQKDVLQRAADDLLAEFYTAGERRTLPRLSGEPGLDVEEIRDTMAQLARTRPPVQRIARKKIERALRRNVFPDAKITTEQIFVEPNATLTSIQRRAMGSAANATPLLLRWLTDLREGRESRQPLLLLGTFGVGKSTLLTVFAHTLLDLPIGITPILIPLRDLAGLADEGFRPVLERYVREEYGVDLAQRPEDESIRYLLLCDGFDELNLYYSRIEASEWALRAHDALASLARRSDVGVILSSRPLVSLERRESQPQLELGLFFKEQIEQWCANYRRVRPNVNAAFNYETLRKRGLAEVAQTPIILYMIALLYEDGFLDREHYTNTDIYRTFIDWTESGGYSRDSSKKEPKHRLPDNYREILQEIAWLIFRSPLGWLPEEELVAALQAKYGRLRRNVVIGSNLLVAHMLQPARGSKGDARLIEFTHQSFREYLVAERLWRLLAPVRNSGGALDVWISISGGFFTKAEVAFLTDMIAATTRCEARDLYDALDALEHPAMYFTEPLWSALPEPGGDTMVEHDIANRAVLAFILRLKLYRHLLGVATKTALPPPPSDRAFRELLDFTSAISQGATAVRGLLLESLSGLRFGPEAELSNIELADAEMQDVQLVAANFKRAVLVGCNLECSSFRKCDFSHASLAAQYLFRTNFVDCTFRSAEIHIENEPELGTTWHNDFSGCDFTEAVFTGLTVRYNRFRGNDWTDARIETEEPAVLERCTLDRGAQRFFRANGAKLINCRLV
jgi:uncharacterized protein YjbI with pentapeptide repeats